MKKRISVVMVVKNEERHVRECLERLKWANEIIILDNGSTDQTVMVAKEYTNNIILDRSAFTDLLYNKPIQKAKGEWVLLIDPDEYISEELAEEIQSVIKETKSEIKGYYIPFKHYFLNHWLRYGGWYPSYLLRLVKKDHAVIDAEIHGKFQIKKQEAGYLRGHILHYGDLSIEQRNNKINLYSTIEAERLMEQNKRVAVTTLLMPGLFRAFKSYVIKLGFLDGAVGFIRASFLFYTTFLSRAKLYEAKYTRK